MGLLHMERWNNTVRVSWSFDIFTLNKKTKQKQNQGKPWGKPLLCCVTGIAFKQAMFSVLAVSWFLNCHLKCKPMSIVEGSLLRAPEPEHGGLEAGGQGSSARWGFPWLRATARWESGSGGRAWGGAVWCLLANYGQEICRGCLFSSNRSGHRQDGLENLL